MVPDEQRWLQTLGLGPGATWHQIEDAYRDLVKVWHPDRFQSDPALRPKAQEKLRALNAAYEQLRRLPRADPSTALARPPASADEPSLTPPEPLPRTKNIGMFTGALVAIAVVVGTFLFLDGRRGAGTADDGLLGTQRDAVTGTESPVTPDPVPRRVAPQPAERSGTEAPLSTEPPAPLPTSGTLAVSSQPIGATVYVDDRPVGKTPLTLSTIVPGVHRIRLELDAFPAWHSSVRIEAGSREKLLAIFEN
jgi:hypothetical protein